LLLFNYKSFKAIFTHFYLITMPKTYKKFALYPCAYLVISHLNLQLWKDNCSFHAFTEILRNTNI